MEKTIAEILFKSIETGKDVFEFTITDGKKVNKRAWTFCAYYFKGRLEAFVDTCGWGQVGTTDDFLVYVQSIINKNIPADAWEMIRLGLID